MVGARGIGRGLRARPWRALTILAAGVVQASGCGGPGAGSEDSASGAPEVPAIASSPAARPPGPTPPLADTVPAQPAFWTISRLDLTLRQAFPEISRVAVPAGEQHAISGVPLPGYLLELPRVRYQGPALKLEVLQLADPGASRRAAGALLAGSAGSVRIFTSNNLLVLATGSSADSAQRLLSSLELRSGTH